MKSKVEEKMILAYDRYLKLLLLYFSLKKSVNDSPYNVRYHSYLPIYHHCNHPAHLFHCQNHHHYRHHLRRQLNVCGLLLRDYGFISLSSLLVISSLNVINDITPFE